ncbi:propionyl-CoA synthetase [Putridiphycobacter roseus]|uniref:Propionyl-CoA synthetase n=1 Tax=Putridiphycobacter roseus TaxID=2219161 RepID=A0A2W1N3I7_9FLAO|nr:acetate--CoA ligase [Putridiphycobacter roseus]PZE17601.1 propionyl-CoA synthetase [Putridiphycobacter roseus]
MNYKDHHKESMESPEKFWGKQAANIGWYTPPKTILSIDEHDYNQWFEDGVLNLSYLCIDKHIEDGYGAQNAIIYESPVTQTKQFITYDKLYQEVAKLAGALSDLGVKKGDTVIIYMPMIPEATYAMLACTRIGAIHSVVFGGFAPHELAIRIDDCKPKLIITASNGVEIKKIIEYKPLVDQAIALSHHQPNNVIIFDRKQGVTYETLARDLDYTSIVKAADIMDPIPVESTHPSYILYTSGTTGKPKGIIRDTGGYATALKYSMENIYDTHPGDVFWAASDVGWVVGHSYIVYAPLINRNTTILFEGKPIKTPDASTFWRIIAEHKVKVMFTAPTAIRAIKKEDPNGAFIKAYDLSSLTHQFLAGERCDVTTLNWAKEQLNVPVIDHWWQTESGWPMIANMMGIEDLPVKPGSAGLPVGGYDIKILNDEGEVVATNEPGYVAVKLPLPPGCLSNLWGNPERFKAGYLERFPGYYFSGDGGYMDSDGYIYITGRVDDIINVAGHRLSTAEMEEIVATHPAVAECAVFGIHCDLKGQTPLGLIVLKSEKNPYNKNVKQEIINSIRHEIGPVASFKSVAIVKRLPKTRSGKTLRKLLRQIADQNDYQTPSTIDDSSIITEIEEVYKSEKIGKYKI